MIHRKIYCNYKNKEYIKKNILIITKNGLKIIQTMVKNIVKKIRKVMFNKIKVVMSNPMVKHICEMNGKSYIIKASTSRKKNFLNSNYV